MRPAILLPLAAMLLASPLAMAQRASLADRVAALEARGAGDQNGVALVNQVSALQAEVQALRGQMEELQQQLEQARQSQRVQYLDLSGRLDRLEGGAPAPATAPQPGEPVAAGARPAEPADPRSRVGAANAAARVQPVRDGFLNAIQQYGRLEEPMDFDLMSH